MGHQNPNAQNNERASKSRIHSAPPLQMDVGCGGLHSQTLGKSKARFSSVDEFEPQRPNYNMRNAWANMNMIINAIHPIAEIYRLSHASRGG